MVFFSHMGERQTPNQPSPAEKVPSEAEADEEIIVLDMCRYPHKNALCLHINCVFGNISAFIANIMISSSTATAVPLLRWRRQGEARHFVQTKI